jgi:hypothetical protein
VSRWGVLEQSGTEKDPLNLNQVMLAEEVRDGKGAGASPITFAFIPIMAAIDKD